MAEFPTTTVLAALTGSTAESPINEGGKWKILPWAVNAGEIHRSADGYTSATSAVELNEISMPLVRFLQKRKPSRLGWATTWKSLKRKLLRGSHTNAKSQSPLGWGRRVLEKPRSRQMFHD